MLERVDRIAQNGKSYFYINISENEYGLCLNENDLQNKSEIERKAIYENEANKKTLESFKRR